MLPTKTVRRSPNVGTFISSPFLIIAPAGNYLQHLSSTTQTSLWVSVGLQNP
ncbi:MAG: hypothetical protein QNJ63_30455 [Calothrix sp. MO_192.B10]|nr:hypothetical protein [Calothrix sp. MO_192.B10]